MSVLSVIKLNKLLFEIHQVRTNIINFLILITKIVITLNITIELKYFGVPLYYISRVQIFTLFYQAGFTALPTSLKMFFLINHNILVKS